MGLGLRGLRIREAEEELRTLREIKIPRFVMRWVSVAVVVGDGGGGGGWARGFFRWVFGGLWCVRVVYLAQRRVCLFACAVDLTGVGGWFEHARGCIWVPPCFGFTPTCSLRLNASFAYV
ncbi:unnamed protein product [Laminaria digitata]